MFLKKSNVSFFPSIFENKKGWKLQKKKSKEEFKKKWVRNTKETFGENQSHLFSSVIVHGVEAQHDHVQDTTKKRTAFKKRTTMTKKRLTEKWKQLRRLCILPCTWFFFFFSVGVRGCRSQLKPTARWWELAAEPFWSLTHFPPPPLSLSVSFSF